MNIEQATAAPGELRVLGDWSVQKGPLCKAVRVVSVAGEWRIELCVRPDGHDGEHIPA